MALLGKEVVSTVHPKYWPYCDTATNSLQYYQSGTGYAANGATFWNGTCQSTFGAKETTAGKTADTYYTYVDITGSHGVMGSIILPMIASTGSAFYTVKLTTDGVEEEFRTVTSTLTANRRRWLGFAKEYAYVNNAATQSDGGFNLYRFYAEDTGVDGYAGGCAIRSTQDMVAQGLPVHIFDTSLKVEVKCSVTGNGNGYECNGGVLVYSHPNI